MKIILHVFAASLTRETSKDHSKESTFMQFSENVLWIYFQVIFLVLSQNLSTKPKLYQNQYQYRQIHIKTKIQDQNSKTSIGFGAYLLIRHFRWMFSIHKKKFARA